VRSRPILNGSRFQREAEVLASLNHPNIAAIYGLEDADGIRALVLELVERPTLAERIADATPNSKFQLPRASEADAAQSRRPRADSLREGFQSPRPSRSQSRSQTRSKRPTSKASSIAT
jgi:hypothetical protein